MDRDQLLTKLRGIETRYPKMTTREARYAALLAFEYYALAFLNADAPIIWDGQR